MSLQNFDAESLLLPLGCSSGDNRWGNTHSTCNPCNLLEWTTASFGKIKSGTDISVHARIRERSLGAFRQADLNAAITTSICVDHEGRRFPFIAILNGMRNADAITREGKTTDCIRCVKLVFVERASCMTGSLFFTLREPSSLKESFTDSDVSDNLWSAPDIPVLLFMKKRIRFEAHVAEVDCRTNSPI